MLNLLSDIQEQLRLTYLIVAHDLALVEHFSLRVGVMYLGGLAEVGPTEQVFTRPSHPYTRALLASVPRPDPDHVIPQGVIFGEVGSALAPPPGCKFHPRCPVAIKPCSVQPPPWSRVGADHRASCHLLEASR